jgi:hypothetical protein
MTTAIDTPRDFDDEEIRYLALSVDVLGKAPSLNAYDRTLLAQLGKRLHDERAARSTVLPCFSMTMPLTVSEDDLPRAPGARPRKPRPEGKKPFQLNLAPSMNVYAGLDPWVLEKARVEIDRRIELAKSCFPRWSCGALVERPMVPQKRRATAIREARTVVVEKLVVTGGRRRIVEFTRHSTQDVDEPAIDILGGKLLIDRLVWAGIIRGDSGEDIVRRGRWVKAPPKQGFVKLVVYEMPRDA